MKRRAVLAAIGLGGIALATYRFWPDQGLRNPCLGPLPEHLLRHDLVRAVFDGLNPSHVWDTHVHLAGVGDSDAGVWLTPQMDSVLHPLQFAQKRFYLNAACADVRAAVDQAYLERLIALVEEFPRGVRLMLLAFDHNYDETGARRDDRSSFHVPDAYAIAVARRFPERFVAIASVHPYRTDAIEALERAASAGARAVKWLPPAMGMDPASPRCDGFYATLARLRLPLLTHAGDELAVAGGDTQELGNPLKLRRALDHGVTVVVAHCASLGSGVDLDQGANAPKKSNFELFTRLMSEPRYHGRLWGEISAMTQFNRVGPALDAVLERSDWHARLLNGSDYPLPGVMPIFSLQGMVERGYLEPQEAPVLGEIRRYNALLFDFALKRRLHRNGKRLPASVFETRRVFEAVA